MTEWLRKLTNAAPQSHVIIIIINLYSTDIYSWCCTKNTEPVTSIYASGELILCPTTVPHLLILFIIIHLYSCKIFPNVAQETLSQSHESLYQRNLGPAHI